MNKLNKYELSFLEFYCNNYDVAYIKVKYNNGFVPSYVTLYNRNKRAIKTPTYCGVTVKNMFSWLQTNKLYAINEILNKGSDV